jgi:uncharacterized YccA/Bax inhibitor family protein
MQTGNPALRAGAFEQVRAFDNATQMTIQGAANKTFFLALIVVMAAALSWANPARLAPFLWPALIGGFVLAIVTVFKKTWAPVTAPIYAFLEGIVLGGISVFFEQAYPGIVMQAVGLTFGVLFAMLFIYKTGLIRVTSGFRLGVFAATGGIALYYLLSMILGFFKIRVPLIYDSGLLGIGFSLFVVIIAALNLILDFDAIKLGAEMRVLKYMEWYSAFALMVTLIWLYIEILRLLSKLRRKD